MAEDCVCTALTSIYTMQSDLFNKMVSRLNAIVNELNNMNNRFTQLVTYSRYVDENSNVIGYANELENIRVSLININQKLVYNDKSIAEIWSYKELCVSNETIVESPLSTFVSKAKLEIDE